MKKTILLSLAVFSLELLSGASQSFQNLGFESATLNPISVNEVQWNPAMPGWTGYLGANPVSSLHYNDQCLSPCTSLAIIDQAGFNWGAPFSGRYSIILTAGIDLGGRYEASIAQTGLIPSAAQSIRFAGAFGGTEPFVVSVAGQELPLYSLNSGPNFTVYGIDVSAFAGQTAELRFTVATDAASAQQGRGSRLMLDAIIFSPTPVPEPSVIVLLLLGACVLCWRAMGIRSRMD